MSANIGELRRTGHKLIALPQGAFRGEPPRNVGGARRQENTQRPQIIEIVEWQDKKDHGSGFQHAAD